MLCDNCDNSDAVFHFTDFSNDSRNEIHLCMNCAKNIKLNSLHQNDMQLIKENERTNGEGGIICINCGLTTKELIYSGRPGCPSCYKYFNSVFNTISANNIKKYSGKKPSNYIEIMDIGHVPALNESQIGLSNSEAHLDEELKRAVIEERYEDAAKLRDKLIEVRKSE
ncbi:MAG: UvrB/UvrC motif-containing protein [Spirochaetes bacterium]|nr:UvrB/UvrC motif-containing protein [Spirochaetota bacterium]